MFFYEGLSCPVCGKPFEEGEDIVACPQCGAPHHRDCWKREGHCHFADAHGTAQQWSRERAQSQAAAKAAMKKCPQCGHENPEFAEFCAHCGCSMEAPDWSAAEPHAAPGAGGGPGGQANASNGQPGQNPYGPGTPPPGGYGPGGYGPYGPYGPFGPGQGYGEYAPYHMQGFDPLGGVPKDEKIADVEVADLAVTVGQNTPYYLPRFYKMDRGASRLSWNWPAFLITPYWLLYRKNYLCGSLMLAFTLIQTFIINYILNLAIPADTTYYSVFQIVQSMMNSPSHRLYFWILFGLSVLNLVLQVVFGIFGNTLYMSTCVNRVKRLRRDHPDDYKGQLPAAGGVSFVLAVLAYFVCQMASMLVVFL